MKIARSHVDTYRPWPFVLFAVLAMTSSCSGSRTPIPQTNTAELMGMTSSDLKRLGITAVGPVKIKGITIFRRSSPHGRLQRLDAKAINQVLYPGDTVEFDDQWTVSDCSEVSLTGSNSGGLSQSFAPSTADFSSGYAFSETVAIPDTATPGTVYSTYISGDFSGVNEQPPVGAQCSYGSDPDQEVVGISVAATPAPTSTPPATPKPTGSPAATPTPCYLLRGAGSPTTTGSINNLIANNPSIQPLSSYLTASKILPTFSVGTATPPPPGTISSGSAAMVTIDFDTISAKDDAFIWNANLIQYLSTLPIGGGYQDPKQILFHEIDHFFYEKFDAANSANERPMPLPGEKAFVASTMSAPTATFNLAGGRQIVLQWTNSVSAAGMVSAGYDGYVHLMIHNDLVSTYGVDNTGALLEALSAADSPPKGEKLTGLLTSYSAKIVTGSFTPLVAPPKVNSQC